MSPRRNWRPRQSTMAMAVTISGGSGRPRPRSATSRIAMTSLRFQAKIEINGINPFVPVDAEQAARLREGWRKPMPVLVQVNGAPAEPWRINMMPRGDGGFFLYLHGEVREAARVGVGDTVDVEVAF